MSESAPQPRRRSLLSASRPWVAFAFIGATAGMLIWSKLRLVSGLPRSAYAVPEAVVDSDGDAAGASDLGGDSGVDGGTDGRTDDAVDGHGVPEPTGRD